MKNFNKKQKIGIIALAIIVVGGAGFGGYEYYLSKNSTANSTDSSISTGVKSTTISEADGTEITLSEGENLITKAGTYIVTGTISNGYIHVKASDKDEVKIILKDASITNENGPAIYVESNGNTYIYLSGNNTINAKATTDLNGAIYSKADLLIDNYDENSSLKITSNIDGIVSKDDLEIDGGNITISAGDDGIVGKDSLKITDGTFNITSTSIGMKSSNEDEADKGNVEITGGTFNISSGGKGIKAIRNMLISGGKITISKSYEGLEANAVTISGGTISITASDDGINATNSDGSNKVNVSGDAKLTISGGNVYVNSTGDGLDSNGSIYISGGTIFVDGPTSDRDGPVDCDGAIEISGGTLIAVGSSGMAQNATKSSQVSVLINLTSSQSGTLTFGDITYTPSKQYKSVLISSSSLSTGKSYDLKIGGTTITTVSISNNITNSGSSGGMSGGRTMR